MTKTIWAVVGVAVAATLAMAIALVVVLSSGDDDSEPEPRVAAPLSVGEGPSDGAAPEELEDFRECLEDEGVELPEPGAALVGDDLEALQEALEACQALLPEGARVFGPGSSGGSVPQN